MKTKFNKLMQGGILIVILTLLASCSSVTVLTSAPEGARVYVQDQPVGYTPYTYTDTKIVGTATPIRLELEGYKPLTTVLVRNEEIDIAPIIGGFCFAWPLWLWSMKYQPMHLYELVPAEK
jgi:hypothetical protein